MAGKQSRHTQLQRRAAGPRGRTEKPQRGRTRLDAAPKGKAIEIERSGRIKPALARLRKETTARKELRVPQKDLDHATEVARRAGINVTIKNLSGTRRRRVNS